MKKLSQLLKKSVPVLVGLAIVLFLIVGCSNFDSPAVTQSADSGHDLWNPQPGEQVIPGREIPLYTNESNGLSVDGVAATPILEPSGVIIGPEGGIVRLGLHTLVVPPGAVDREIVFTMNYASQTAVAVDCGPSPFHFNVPVELTLSYKGTSFERSAQQNTLQIFYMANTASFSAMPSHVDVANKTVTAQLDHFSRYIIS